jgi:predicted nucleic acid-binding protein
MIHLDTNFLVASLALSSPQQAQVDAWLLAGETVTLSAITWAEFLCGSTSTSVSGALASVARGMFPRPEAFLSEDAEFAARLYNLTGRPKKLLADCMIAASAIRRGAALATLNLSDFRRFVPHGLQLA